MNAATFGSTMFLALAIAACGSGSSPRNAGTEGAAIATEPEPAAPAPATPVPRKVELPSGTLVLVRLDRALSTARDRTGDVFGAILDEPVVVNGVEILPNGTRFAGHVTTSETSGRLKGRGVLGITLDAFETGGRRYPIATSLDTRTTEAHKKRNIEMIGGGTGLGALIGGLAGGKKGAGIGAAVGATAGTGVAAATGEKAVEVPARTAFRFSLKRPVEVSK